MESGPVIAAIIGATISVLGSVVVVTISHHLTKKNELASEWRRQKFEHYRKLLSSFSDRLARIPNEKSDEGNQEMAEIQARLAESLNTLLLIAPRSVIQHAGELNAIINGPSKEEYVGAFKVPLTKLVSEIRRDLSMEEDEFPSDYRCPFYGRTFSNTIEPEHSA